MEVDCAHTDPKPLDDKARTCQCGKWGYITTNRLLKDGVPVGTNIPGCADNLPIRLLDAYGCSLG